MKNLQILKYVRKLLPIILIFCICATYMVYYKLSSSNTYVASEVIHYNDEQAEKGLAPTGDKLDVNEIKSSAVMSRVVEKMGLTGIYSVDSLTSRISITPIPDADKVAQKEAKLEEGEEYVYEPSTYIVSFTATNKEGPTFARTILDETLDVYFAEFSQKYVNVAPANNTIENIYSGEYDYIEMVELIDASIDDTLLTLYQRMEKSPYYRSTQSGVSFNDLADEFNYLREGKVSALFSRYLAPDGKAFVPQIFPWEPLYLTLTVILSEEAETLLHLPRLTEVLLFITKPRSYSRTDALKL